MSDPTLHLTVAAIVPMNESFLMVRERVDGEVVLNQPAGHVEPGESLTEAVVREALEETAWELEPTDLVGIYRWDRPGSGETFFRAAFAMRPVRHHPSRQLDPEILQAVWMSHDEIAAARRSWRSPMVMRVIEDYLAGHRHPVSLLVDVNKIPE